MSGPIRFCSSYVILLSVLVIFCSAVSVRRRILLEILLCLFKLCKLEVLKYHYLVILFDFSGIVLCLVEDIVARIFFFQSFLLLFLIVMYLEFWLKFEYLAPFWWLRYIYSCCKCLNCCTSKLWFRNVEIHCLYLITLHMYEVLIWIQ